MPERLPVYRRVGGWAYGWVYPGPDRLDPHAAPDGHGEGGQAAVRLVAVRGLRRGLPGEDRHPAPAGPPAASGRQRALADELARASGSPGGPLGLGHGRAAALQAGDDGVRLGVRMARFLPWHPGKLGAWTRGRALPEVPAGSFRSWWRKHGDELKK